MLVVEFELGVWKMTFIHLVWILVANGGTSVQELNLRSVSRSFHAFLPNYLFQLPAGAPIWTFNNSAIQGKCLCDEKACCTRFWGHSAGLFSISQAKFWNPLYSFSAPSLYSRTYCPNPIMASYWTFSLSLQNGMPLLSSGFTQSRHSIFWIIVLGC